jgi:hypothetical protein
MRVATFLNLETLRRDPLSKMRAMARAIFVLSLTLFLAYAAEAGQSAASPEIGTPEQRREAISACGRDAMSFCRELKASDGAFAYLACLQKNRSRLRSSCVALLERYGQ